MSLIKHWVRLTPTAALVDDRVITTEGQGNAMLTALYRQAIGDYPKFFKMDPLCKVGFVASELLLKAEGTQRESWGTERGVVLFNSAASLADDKKYQETIDSPDNFFPSPAVFVYTLPNVVTGEIAIRNKYYGETNCVVAQRDARLIGCTLRYAFDDADTQSLITGWVDSWDADTFDVVLFIVERDMVNNIETLENEISILLNK